MNRLLGFAQYEDADGAEIAMVTLTRVPISCFVTRCSMTARASSKDIALT